MPSYPELAGRVVLITGATGGLGRALAAAYAREGASIALSDLDAKLLADVALDLGLVGDSTLTIQADLSDPALAEPMVDQIVQRFGQIDILVNNAAIIARMPLEQVTTSEFERVLRVNLVSPFLLARAAFCHMRERGSGRIVNIASAAARTGGASDVHMYAASKAGLVSVTRSMARVAGPAGVLVNAILPANVDTTMLHETFSDTEVRRVIEAIPLGRVATTDEIAELAVWLSSDAASYVTGAAWDINGGWVMS